MWDPHLQAAVYEPPFDPDTDFKPSFDANVARKNYVWLQHWFSCMYVGFEDLDSRTKEGLELPKVPGGPLPVSVLERRRVYLFGLMKNPPEAKEKTGNKPPQHDMETAGRILVEKNWMLNLSWELWKNEQAFPTSDIGYYSGQLVPGGQAKKPPFVAEHICGHEVLFSNAGVDEEVDEEVVDVKAQLAKVNAMYSPKDQSWIVKVTNWVRQQWWSARETRCRDLAGLAAAIATYGDPSDPKRLTDFDCAMYVVQQSVKKYDYILKGLFAMAQLQIGYDGGQVLFDERLTVGKHTRPLFPTDEDLKKNRKKWSWTGESENGNLFAFWVSNEGKRYRKIFEQDLLYVKGGAPPWIGGTILFLIMRSWFGAPVNVLLGPEIDKEVRTKGFNANWWLRKTCHMYGGGDEFPVYLRESVPMSGVFDQYGCAAPEFMPTWAEQSSDVSLEDWIHFHDETDARKLLTLYASMFEEPPLKREHHEPYEQLGEEEYAPDSPTSSVSLLSNVVELPPPVVNEATVPYEAPPSPLRKPPQHPVHAQPVVRIATPPRVRPPPTPPPFGAGHFEHALERSGASNPLSLFGGKKRTRTEDPFAGTGVTFNVNMTQEEAARRVAEREARGWKVPKPVTVYKPGPSKYTVADLKAMQDEYLAGVEKRKALQEGKASRQVPAEQGPSWEAVEDAAKAAQRRRNRGEEEEGADFDLSTPPPPPLTDEPLAPQLVTNIHHDQNYRCLSPLPRHRYWRELGHALTTKDEEDAKAWAKRKVKKEKDSE